MKISSIEFSGLTDEGAKKTFLFGGVPDEGGNIFFNVDELPGIIGYVFFNDKEAVRFDGSAEIVFRVKSDEFIITKTRAGGKDAVALKKTTGGKVQRLAKPYETLADIFECSPREQLSGCVIGSGFFAEFQKNPSVFHFETIGKMKENAEKAEKINSGINEKIKEAKKSIKTLPKNINRITEEQVREASSAWSAKENEYSATLENIINFEKEVIATRDRDPIKTELEANENKIMEFLKGSEKADALRIKIRDHYKVQELIPKLREILDYRRQLGEIMSKIKENQSRLKLLEIQRLEQEGLYAAVNGQIAALAEKGSRFIIIRNENGDVADYSGIDLNEELEKLNAEKEEAEAELDSQRGKIAELSGIISGIEAEIKNGDVSSKTVTDFEEGIRLDEKIKELKSLIAEKEKEFKLAEEEIGLKEKQYQELNERFKKLFSLDKEAAPFKSKEEVARILEERILKNELILESLEQKESKIREEIQNLDLREIEIDRAIDGLREILAEKEAERDNFLKRQAIYRESANEGDEGGSRLNAPMSSAFLDERVEAVKLDLEARANTKTDIVSEKTGLQYALSEIGRQKSIAAGDIAACRKEDETFDGSIRKLRNSLSGDHYTAKHIAEYFDALGRSQSSEFVLALQKSAVKAGTELELLRSGADRKSREIQELLTKLQTLEESAPAAGLLADQFFAENEAKNVLLENAQKLAAAQSELNERNEIIKETGEKLFEIKGKISLFSQYRTALENGTGVEAFTKEEAEIIKKENEEALAAAISEKDALEKEIEELSAAVFREKSEAQRLNGELNKLKENFGGKKSVAAMLVEDLQGESIGSIKRKTLSKDDLENIAASIKKFDETLAALRKKSDSLRLRFKEQKSPSDEEEMLRNRLKAEYARKQKLAYDLELLKKKLVDTTVSYLVSAKNKLEADKISGELAAAESIKSVYKHSGSIGQDYAKKLKKYVNAADKNLSVLTEGRYALTVKDDILFIDGQSGKSVDFAGMAAGDRYLAYVALSSALPAFAGGKCDTVILDGRVFGDGEEEAEISSRLKSFTDKVFVTNVS